MFSVIQSAPMEGVTRSVFRAAHWAQFDGVDTYFTPFLAPTADGMFSEKEIRELIAACSADIPEKKEPELLFNAVREVHRRGAVLNARPNRWNIAALSVPVRDHAGNVIAALTIVGCGEDFAGNKRNEWELLLKSFIQ